MREIKFRGRRITDGTWTYGDLIHSFDLVYVGDEYQFLKENIVVTASIGQYTGLIDKNGTPIYEGDIIKVNYTVKYADRDKQDEEHTATTIVFWNDFRASFALEFHKYANDDLYRFVRDKYAEVIGNIHENPELLSIPTPREQIPDGGMEE